MLFNRYLLIYVIGITLSFAYNPSIASPSSGGFYDDGRSNFVKVEKQQTNPWARNMPMERDAGRYFLPRMPDYNESRFITDEELDMLNNAPASNKHPDSSRGSMPLQMRQRPKYKAPTYYQPSANQYNTDSAAGEVTDRNQWGEPENMLPVDPMDPGRYGTPFSGPFQGIDSFIYE